MSYILSIIMLGIVLLIINIGVLFLIFKKMKSTAGKAILSIISIIGSIAVFIVGFIFIVGAWGVNTGKEIAQNIQQQAEEKASLYQVRNSNGETKDIYEQNETVLGNGFELKILSTARFMDATQTLFTPKIEYCLVNVQITNKIDEKRSVSTFNFNFSDDENKVISPQTYFYDEQNRKEYNSKLVEMEPQQTVVFPLAAKCSENPTKVVLQEIPNSVISTDDKDYSIRFKVAF